MRESMTHRKRAKDANAQHRQQHAMLFGDDSAVAQVMHTLLPFSNEERADDDADPHFGRDRLLGGDIIMFACARVSCIYIFFKGTCAHLHQIHQKRKFLT